MDMLLTILENAFAAGEKALVFTQYTTMTTKLSKMLAAKFGGAFPVYNGGMGQDARARVV